MNCLIIITFLLYFLLLLFCYATISEDTLRRTQQHNGTSERQSKLADSCKKSHEVSDKSQRLSKLANAFEESLRLFRDSDNTEQSNSKSVDLERTTGTVGSAEESLNVTVMERCLVVVTQPSPGEPEEQEELISRKLADDDDDDDDDCSSLLESLTDLESQLQQEIGQTQQRLHDSCEAKRGVENSSHNTRTSVEERHDSVKSIPEHTINVPATTTALAATTTTTTTTTTTGYC